MPVFGNTSHGRLVTCHRDIQTVMIEAIKYFDFMVIEGHRPIETQHKYFTKGRELHPGADPKEFASWVIADKSKVITHLDGYTKKGRHNYDPSKAIDIAPYPVEWGNEVAFNALSALILSISNDFMEAKRITHPLKWGGHWKTFKDLPHYQI